MRGHADALFLDVRTPWEYLDHALRAVRPGGMFGFLLPTVDQVSKLLLGIEQRPFAEVKSARSSSGAGSPSPIACGPKTA